ncbi:MAG TPA: succinate dehydrogenase, hydrophobic membrane anchor protein [Gammaproteobacteria bacterium]
MMRTPLKRVEGLGSAKSGTEHFWMQRLTAIALAPLGVWFVVSVLTLIGAEHADVAEWMTHPVNAVLLALMSATLFYHSKLGVQVVFEDYVHTEWLKITALILNNFIHVLLGVAAVISVLRVAFGG